jgi:16S rRNA (guanine966-N2)-methyltransferase
VPAGARPSGARLREALYSIWGERVAGAQVLDLYAGSGGVGLEALSRGAASAAFVEKSRPALAALRSNLGLAGGSARLVPLDAVTALKRLAREGVAFDLLFVDPPYDTEVGEREMALLAAVAREGAQLAFERRAGQTPPPGGAAWVLTSTRRYGDSELHFFRRSRA